jgi:hypothetical protein
MAAAALAAVASLAEERGGENKQTIFDVVVESFLKLRVLRG